MPGDERATQAEREVKKIEMRNLSSIACPIPAPIPSGAVQYMLIVLECTFANEWWPRVQSDLYVSELVCAAVQVAGVRACRLVSTLA